MDINSGNVLSSRSVVFKETNDVMNNHVKFKITTTTNVPRYPSDTNEPRYPSATNYPSQERIFTEQVREEPVPVMNDTEMKYIVGVMDNFEAPS